MKNLKNMKKINFLNSEKIFRLTPLSGDSVDVANQIIEKNVKVFPKLRNVLVDNLSDLWEMQFTSSPSTYCLYIYALYPVSYLLNAFEQTGDEKYLEQATELTLDFIFWESKEKLISEKKSKILNGDHAVSNRTQAMCYLVCCLWSCDKKIPQSVVTTLLNNANYLADEDNYSHYNHGLMMDLALVGLLNIFKKLDCIYPKDIEDKLSHRLERSLVRDLTKDGVHIENSPGYHFWMLGFLERISPSLELFNKGLFDKAASVLMKAREYAQYVTKPDRTVPQIGDTHAGVKHVTSNALPSKFFSNSNQVIFRSPAGKSWAILSSGYKTHVHKHEDNGAFNLFYSGIDIFMDPGFLNYETDEDSISIRAASSHNVPLPYEHNRQSIKRLNIEEVAATGENLSRSDILAFHKGRFIEAALALIADYESSDIFRMIVKLGEDAFFIFDVLDTGVGLESRFTLGPSLKVIETNDTNALILEGSHEVKFEQILLNKGIGNVVSNKVTCAVGFGEKTLTNQLCLGSKTDYNITYVEFQQYSLSLHKERISKMILFRMRRRKGNVNLEELVNEIEFVFSENM